MIPYFHLITNPSGTSSPTKKTGEQILSISKGYRTSVMAPALKKLPQGSWFVDDVDGNPCNGLF